jgi:hypothetical protein
MCRREKGQKEHARALAHTYKEEGKIARERHTKEGEMEGEREINLYIEIDR